MIILDFLLLALLFYFMVKSYLWVGGNEIGFKGTRGMLVKKPQYSCIPRFHVQ